MNDRTKNAARNIKFAVISKIYQIIIPFLIRTILIYKLGMAYLGLNSLFSSILGVLNLAELGIGSVLIFSMYKPIVEKNTSQICALMNFYKKCYRVIGTSILVMGIIIMPFLSKVIKSDIPPEINIYYIYVIQLLSTVSSYFMYAYKCCLFKAHQREDILSKIGLISDTLIYILQIIVLFTCKNYYIYILIIPIINICSNCAISYIASKYYPQYICNGSLDKCQLVVIQKKIKSLFTMKIGSVVLSSVDPIVVSAFLGLTVLGVYNNYIYIINSVIAVVGLFTSSIIPTLGSSLVTESKEKNYSNFCKLTFLNFWLVSWCSVCLICLYQHFIYLWVGKDNMLSLGHVILLTAYFYVMQSNQVAGAYKDAAGIWDRDQFRPLITACVNLVLNLVLVKYWKLYGVVLSTVVSLLFINTPWLIFNVTKYVFHKPPVYYLKKWIINLLVTILTVIITYCACSIISNSVFGFVEKIVICIFLPNLIIWICYRKTNVYRECKSFFLKLLRYHL